MHQLHEVQASKISFSGHLKVGKVYPCAHSAIWFPCPGTGVLTLEVLVILPGKRPTESLEFSYSEAGDI